MIPTPPPARTPAVLRDLLVAAKRAEKQAAVAADENYVLGVTYGLRAWHEEWSSERVAEEGPRLERMREAIREARRELEQRGNAR